MIERNNKIFTLTTLILSIIILLIGATFSYFTMIEKSKNNELDIEETNLRICEKTDNFTYFLGNICLGKMWGIILRKFFQSLCKILDGK